MSKAKGKALQNNEYVYLLYGGCMKLGYIRFGSTTDDIDTHLEQFKEHYGDEVKARFVKVTESATHLDSILQKHHENAYHGYIFEINVTQGVTALRDATGAKNIKTWNVYTDDDTVQVATEPTTSTTSATTAKKGTVVKKQVAVVVEEPDEEEEEVEEEEEEGEEEGEAEEEEEEEEIVVAPIITKKTVTKPATKSTTTTATATATASKKATAAVTKPAPAVITKPAPISKPVSKPVAKAGK